MAVAVICEFNPFHNGHKYLLRRAKELTGEPVLAVMSGSFTQRGEVAVCSKFERARAALNNGADLVAELPTAYAVAPAEIFARGGVSIAGAFGDVRYLAFGCECGDIRLLTGAAAAFKNPEVNALIAEQMKRGAYYPQAVERAVREVMGDVADVLTSPNNILAVEYIKALDGSATEPLPIQRIGVPHDSETADGSTASASLIRKMLRAGESAESFMPEPPAEITYPALLERALLFRLRSMTAEDFKRLPEVTEGLENRIVKAAAENNSIEEILSSVKTKRYTHARLRRIITCAALDITRQLQARRASYVRVLGFTPEGERLLKSCSFEIVTSPAKALRQGGANADFLKTDIAATDAAALAYKKIRRAGEDYSAGILRVQSRLKSGEIFRED